MLFATGAAALALFAEAAADGPTGASTLQMLPMFLMILALAYFLLLRPEMKQKQTREEFFKNLQKNDRVVTSGGILGIVTQVKEQTVVLRVDDGRGVTIEFTKAAVVDKV